MKTYKVYVRYSTYGEAIVEAESPEDVDDIIDDAEIDFAFEGDLEIEEIEEIKE